MGWYGHKISTPIPSKMLHDTPNSSGNIFHLNKYYSIIHSHYWLPLGSHASSFLLPTSRCIHPFHLFQLVYSWDQGFYPMVMYIILYILHLPLTPLRKETWLIFNQSLRWIFLLQPMSPKTYFLEMLFPWGGFSLQTTFLGISWHICLVIYIYGYS